MKQIIQSLKDGTTRVVDVPSPALAPGSILVKTSTTLVSAGTERMLVEFGRASWMAKAKRQPDKVRMVLDKARTDGVMAAIDAVKSKLDEPLLLGYCNVGTIAALGPGATGFATGDRVVSNGKHAEVVRVPMNLCAKVPDGVSDETASFTVLASIGLQGVRLVQPTIGECIVVMGLGLIGLLTVQILKAHGCRVLGIDVNPARLALAQQFGAETVDLTTDSALEAAQTFSRGRGVDAVIIAASTQSKEPVSRAAKMCRKRGRIVLVGVVGLELSRADFYEKELTFQVSCSYGPGRYDPLYEEGGQDYPIGFVRWTEQRNFEAVLDLMASGKLDVSPLITHRFPLDRAVEAYDLLASNQPSLGILIEYPRGDLDQWSDKSVTLRAPAPEASRELAGGQVCSVAFIGAGNYAGRVLIPAFKAGGALLRTIVSSGGVSSVHHGRKYGFELASTDVASAIEDSSINSVVIATRHNAHARQVLAGLRAGKNVFCEKPLCLTHEELLQIEAEARARPSQLLMVGFNRRFSPHVLKIRELLDPINEPKVFIVTVNAGSVPADHWVQDKLVGGGRLVGEGCHFIDMLRFLTGAPIRDVTAVAVGPHQGVSIRDDKTTIVLSFADGSIGTIHYLANGDKGFPKERLEVFAAGRILQLDNFRKLRGWGWKRFARMNLWRQEKGQDACAQAFVDAVRQGGPSPIPLDEILEVSRVSIEVQALVGNA